MEARSVGSKVESWFASAVAVDRRHSRRNSEPKREGVARKETRKVTIVRKNEITANRTSHSPYCGIIIVIVIRTTTTIKKIIATRSPFSRGLN